MRRAHPDAYRSDAWKNPFYTPRNDDFTKDDYGIGAEFSSTPTPTELFQKFRTFKGYFVERLAELKQERGYQQDPDEVEEIEYFLGVMSDMQAEQTHGAEGIQEFISRIHEMVRKNPMPLKEPPRDNGGSSASTNQNENAGETSGNFNKKTESQKDAGHNFNYFATVEESYKDPQQKERSSRTEWGCGGGDDFTFARRSSEKAESRVFGARNPVSPRANVEIPLPPFGRGGGRGPAFNVLPRPAQRIVPQPQSARAEGHFPPKHPPSTSGEEVGPVPPTHPASSQPPHPKNPQVDGHSVGSVGSVHSFRDPDGKEQLFERRTKRGIDTELPNGNEVEPPLSNEEECDDNQSHVPDINSLWEEYVSTTEDGSRISSRVYGKFRDLNPPPPQIFPSNLYSNDYLRFQGLAGGENIYQPGVVPNPFFRGRFVNPVPAPFMDEMAPPVNVRAPDPTGYIHPNIDDDSWNADLNVNEFDENDNTGNIPRDTDNFIPVVEPRPVDFKAIARQKAQECFLRNRKRRQRFISPEEDSLSSLDPRADSTRYQQRLNKMNPCGGGPRIKTNPNIPNSYEIQGKNPTKPWHRQQGWSNLKNRNAAFSNVIQTGNKPNTKGNTVLGNYSAVKSTVAAGKGTRRVKRKEAVGNIKNPSKAQQLKNQVNNEGLFVLGKKEVRKVPKEATTVDENSKSGSSSSVVSSRVSSSNGQEHAESRTKAGKRKAHSSKNNVSDSEETACSAGARKSLNKKSKLTKSRASKESEIPLPVANIVSGMRQFRIPKLNKKLPAPPSSTSSNDVETLSETDNVSRKVKMTRSTAMKQTCRKSTGKASTSTANMSKRSADKDLRTFENQTSRKSTAQMSRKSKGGRKSGTEARPYNESDPDWDMLNDPVYLCQSVIANDESDQISITNSELSTANNPGGTFEDNLDPVFRKSKTKKKHPPATRAQLASTCPLQTPELIRESKFIGRNDLVANQGLGKIKMECDYVPTYTVKGEPDQLEVEPDEDLYLKGVYDNLKEFENSEPVMDTNNEENIPSSPPYVFNFTMPSFSSDDEEDLDNIENLVLNIQPDDVVQNFTDGIQYSTQEEYEESLQRNVEYEKLLLKNLENAALEPERTDITERLVQP